MVFHLKKQDQRTVFNNTQDFSIVPGPPIKSFLGTFETDGRNIIDFRLGELIYSKNVEYRYSGDTKFLRTKRGSTLLKDVELKAVGSGYFKDASVEFHVWVDENGNLKYLDENSVIQTITTGLDGDVDHEFFMYQLASNETLYGSSETDGIYKITKSGGVLVYATVLSGQAVSSMSFSNISGRNFIGVGSKLGYSNVQNQTASDTSNLETYDMGASGKWVWINPGKGGDIQRVIDNGEITFIFKDIGIWALINAEMDISSWLIPQAKADQGTRSPKTVVYARYGNSEGFIYLASDKTLRFFNGTVERNAGNAGSSGSASLVGGESFIISKPYQKILKDIPDGQLSKCTATFFDGRYILGVVSESGTDVDTVLEIDTDKLMPLREGDDIRQPFWSRVEEMNFTHFNIKDQRELYGFNTSGFLSRLFVDDTYHEEVPDRIFTDKDFRDYIEISSVSGTFQKGEQITGGSSGTTAAIDIESTTDLLVKNTTNSWTVGETITGGTSGATATISSVVRRIAIEWEFYTGWYKYSDRELKLYDSYLNWQVDGRWNVIFSVNSFILGGYIPRYDDGATVEIKPQHLDGAYFDVDFFNQAFFDASTGQLSQNTGKEARGNYFSFGFKNFNYGEWATIYGIEPRFTQVKDSPIGNNF